MVDSIYRTRSLGVAAAGLRDQYADGVAAKLWELYVGSSKERTENYKEWICNILRENGCQNILDAACGTGVDSVMLVDEGFAVVSTDASDKMLKYALKYRWDKRREERYDKWVIEEANWLSLVDDLRGLEGVPEEGFDAVLCFGNSFPHLPDFEGDQSVHKAAISQFKAMIKPGGVFLIDHRNYDAILEYGYVPHGKNVFYAGSYIEHIKCSNLYVNSDPRLVTLDYWLDIERIVRDHDDFKKLDSSVLEKHRSFRLSYFPHRLKPFTQLIDDIFGETDHKIYGDFYPMGQIEKPVYYTHIVKKRLDDKD